MAFLDSGMDGNIMDWKIASRLRLSWEVLPCAVTIKVLGWTTTCKDDTSVGRVQVYSLLGPTQQAMEKYITESFATGLIWPSTSPAESRFFLLEKKDKSLRPCIDYWRLSEITIRNQYPLPLIVLCVRLKAGHHYLHQIRSEKHLPTCLYHRRG